MPKQYLPLQKNWYIIRTYPGCEEVVVQDLKKRIKTFNIEDKIFNIIVPKEKKIKIKQNQRQLVEEKIYPGYVLVEMIVTDNSWYIVRNTPNVTGFIGSTTTPIPVSEQEMENLKKRMAVEAPQHKIEFNIGDLIQVIDGPFKDSNGKISEIDTERGKVKVLINIFGRDTPVELDSLQIKKV